MSKRRSENNYLALSSLHGATTAEYAIALALIALVALLAGGALGSRVSWQYDQTHAAIGGGSEVGKPTPIPGMPAPPKP